LSYG